jgi:Protein of unknown function (DUF1232)
LILIPDFIPVFGQLDELVVLPLGILLAVKLIPPEIMAEHRAAALEAEGKPGSRVAAAVIIAIWVGAAAILIWLFWQPALAEAGFRIASYGVCSSAHRPGRLSRC